jgi:hypothetical protein
MRQTEKRKNELTGAQSTDERREEEQNNAEGGVGASFNVSNYDTTEQAHFENWS